MSDAPPRRRRSVLPGFGLTLGFTCLYLAVIVVIPLAGLVAKAGTLSWAGAVATLANPRALSAFRVSFGMALLASLANQPYIIQHDCWLQAVILTAATVAARSLRERCWPGC